MVISTGFAYFLGGLVGLMLGLVGGGGVFLLPIMLFLLGQPLPQATAHTTILVGVTALIGAVPRIRVGLVDWPTAIALGIPVTAGMLLVRGWLFYALPTELFAVGGHVVTREGLVLGFFTLMLLLSFASMTNLVGADWEPRTELKVERPVAYYSLLVVLGLAIGIIPGLAGAGGGVLIVPLLVVLFGLPMKTVVGTSLTIVATKSIVGFCGDIYNLGDRIDGMFLLGFAGVMLLGVAIGSLMNHRLDSNLLKRIFAWFVLALAIFIPVKMMFFAPADPASDQVEDVTQPGSETGGTELEKP